MLEILVLKSWDPGFKSSWIPLDWTWIFIDAVAKENQHRPTAHNDLASNSASNQPCRDFTWINNLTIYNYRLCFYLNKHYPVIIFELNLIEMSFVEKINLNNWSWGKFNFW